MFGAPRVRGTVVAGWATDFRLIGVLSAVQGHRGECEVDGEAKESVR